MRETERQGKKGRKSVLVSVYVCVRREADEKHLKKTDGRVRRLMNCVRGTMLGN